MRARADKQLWTTAEAVGIQWLRLDELSTINPSDHPIIYGTSILAHFQKVHLRPGLIITHDATTRADWYYIRDTAITNAAASAGVADDITFVTGSSTTQEPLLKAVSGSTEVLTGHTIHKGYMSNKPLYFRDGPIAATDFKDTVLTLIDDSGIPIKEGTFFSENATSFPIEAVESLDTVSIPTQFTTYNVTDIHHPDVVTKTVLTPRTRAIALPAGDHWYLNAVVPIFTEVDRPNFL
nr:MAG: hypothetical protein [Wufeng shrew hepevirus 2]